MKLKNKKTPQDFSKSYFVAFVFFEINDGDETKLWE